MVKTTRNSVGGDRGRRFRFLALGFAAALFAGFAAAQDPAELVVDPPELTLEVGSTAQLTATVRDAAGNELERGVVFFSRATWG